MTTKEILWNGGFKNLKHPFQAFFCGPLFSLAAVAWMVLIVVFKGLFKAETFGFIAIVTAYTLAIAYAVTLIYGVPVFLYLSRHNVAGLVPTVLAGTVPAAVLWLGTRGAYYSDRNFLVHMSLVCGVLSAFGYWGLARGQFQTLRNRTSHKRLDGRKTV